MSNNEEIEILMYNGTIIPFKISISPITTMGVSQVFVTIIIVIVSDHFVCLTLETHTLAASIAGDSIAPVNSFDRHSAFIIGTFPDIVLLHKFLEKQVTSVLSLFTRHPWVVV